MSKQQNHEENVLAALESLEQRGLIKSDEKLDPTKTHFFGECEWTLRDSDGNVVDSGRQKNLVTKNGRIKALQGSSLGRYLFISQTTRTPRFDLFENIIGFDNGDGGPNPVKDVGTQTGWDLNTLTRTITATYAQPVTTRNITMIGIGWMGGLNPYQNTAGDNIPLISTALSISPAIVQTAANTLDVVYKITVIPPTAKQLSRFAMPGRQGAGYYFARWWGGFTSEAMERNLMPHTFGQYMFTDGDMPYANVGIRTYEGLGLLGGGSLAQFGGYTSTTETKTVPESNSDAVGAFGMQAGGWQDSLSFYERGPADISNPTNAVASAINTWPLAAGFGEIGNVFAHPVNRSYAFDEAGVVPVSQGSVVVNTGKNYTPDTKIGPAHWLYRIVNAVAGDTAGGTEGEYLFTRRNWVADPLLPPVDAAFAAKDGVNLDLRGAFGFTPGPGRPGNSLDMIFMGQDVYGSNGIWYPNNAPTGNGTNSGVFRTSVYDGRDSWWGLQMRNRNIAGWSPPEGLMRWRVGTNEAMEPRTLVQDTRFVLDDGSPIGVPIDPAPGYGQRLTTDGDGVVFYATLDGANPTGQAGNEIYALDNTKPGRWYQRPSGDAAAGNTFTVQAADEIHEMQPFVAGDVGKKIRLVNTLNGNDSIRTITVFNGPNSVDVDGAAFVAETGMTWHWTLVSVIDATQGLAVGLIYGMFYDQVLGRFWVAGENGIQLSLDSGATWSVILNETTPNTPLSNQDARDFGYPQSPDAVPATGGQSYDMMGVDNNGDLYWVDRGVNGAGSGPAVDKFAMTGPGDTIGAVGGGTHTRIALTAFPTNGVKPTQLQGLLMNNVACDEATGTGELWLFDNRNENVNRDFYRLPLNSFTAGNITAFNPLALPTVAAGTFNGNAPWSAFVTKGGEVNFLPDGNFVERWYTWSPLSGFFYQNGSITPGSTWCIQDMTGGSNYTTFPDGRTLIGLQPNSGQLGALGSQDQTWRWDDVALVWRPWEGSGAQFDTRYGTTNGGLKKMHAAFEPILDGIQVKFVDDPGTVTPTDQFVQYETEVFPVAYGLHRTNIDALTWTGFGFRLPSETFIESEAAKVASGPGSMAVHQWQGAANAPYPGQDASPPAGAGLGVPLLDGANGKNWGWEPKQWADGAWLDGTGDSPNTDANTQGRMAFILDLGAATQVAKLRFAIRAIQSPLNENYTQGAGVAPSTNKRRINLYTSNTGTAFAELDTDLRYPNGPSQFSGPNDQEAAKWDNVYHLINAGFRTVASRYVDIVEFDLVEAGILAAARTQRYWQFTFNDVGAGITNRNTVFGSLVAFDDAGNVLGMTADHALDVNQFNDTEFQAAIIDEAFWIQDEPGGGGGATTISTAGGPDTDTVTVDAGSFDVANIDITQDYLVWDEGNPKGSGFLRAGETDGGVPNSSRQAMARIIAKAAGTLQVDKATIPGGLTNVAWEVRRPATVTTTNPENALPDQFGYDPVTGYFSHCEANLTAGRKFRVTRYGVVRVPQ
jgi:hypothetical protein